MKHLLPYFLLTVLLFGCNGNEHKIKRNKLSSAFISGDYAELKLAYDPQTQIISGYLENSEQGNGTKNAPQFSCSFYFAGKLSGNKAAIISYSPTDIFPADSSDLIKGTFEKISSKQIAIQLKSDHGGCGMIETLMTTKPATFWLDTKKNWVSINYITSDKAFFYTTKNESSKAKSYLVKGNVVYIDKKDNEWLHCTYYDDTHHQLSGWIKSHITNTLIK